MTACNILRRKGRVRPGLDDAIAAMIRRGCVVDDIMRELRCGAQRVARVRAAIGLAGIHRGGRKSFVQRSPGKAARAFAALRNGASFKDAAELVGAPAWMVERAWKRAVAEGRERPQRRRGAKVTGPERMAIAAALAAGEGAVGVAADLGFGVTVVRAVKAKTMAAALTEKPNAFGGSLAIRFEDDRRAVRADRGGARLGSRAGSSGWGAASSIAGLG